MTDTVLLLGALVACLLIVIRVGDDRALAVIAALLIVAVLIGGLP